MLGFRHNPIGSCEFQYTYGKAKLFQTTWIIKMFLNDLIFNNFKDLNEMFHAVINHLNITITKAVD